MKKRTKAGRLARAGRWFRDHWIIATVILVGIAGGLGFAWLSLRSVETRPWLSNMAANASVTIVFLVPAALLGLWLQRLVDTVRHVANEADDSTHKVASALDRLAPREQVSDELAKREQDKSQAAIDVYKQWGHHADREHLITALDRARTSDLISTRGLRVPIWELDTHARFSYAGHGNPVVAVEALDGTVRAELQWEPNVQPVEFYERLMEHVANEGGYLGYETGDPTQFVLAASETLVFAQERRNEKHMGSDYFRQIIERVDGWYITEFGLFPEVKPYYLINRARLNDPFWERHLKQKPDFPDPERALWYARAIFGIEIDWHLQR